MRSRRPILVLLLCLLLPSCSILGFHDEQRERLERNRRIWREEGRANYQFEFRKGCFCPHLQELYPATVAVRAHTIRAVLDPESGDPLPSPRSDTTALAEFPDMYVTVETLFAVIERAIEEDYARLEAEYHDDLGYPMHIDLESGGATDDEVTYRASNLVLQ